MLRGSGRTEEVRLNVHSLRISSSRRAKSYHLKYRSNYCVRGDIVLPKASIRYIYFMIVALYCTKHDVRLYKRRQGVVVIACGITRICLLLSCFLVHPVNVLSCNPFRHHIFLQSITQRHMYWYKNCLFCCTSVHDNEGGWVVGHVVV